MPTLGLGSFSLTLMILLGVTMMSTGKSCESITLSEGSSSGATICFSSTVVTTTVLSGSTLQKRQGSFAAGQCKECFDKGSGANRDLFPSLTG